MSRVPGPAQEHDIPVRPWNVSDVRGQNVRVSDLQEDCRKENIAVLDLMNFN